MRFLRQHILYHTYNAVLPYQGFPGFEEWRVPGVREIV